MTANAAALDPVTARWAGALFNLAKRQGVLDVVSRDVERLGAEFSNPRVRAYVLGSQSSGAERLATLDKATSDFHGLTKNFVRLAFDRRREGILAGVAEAFRRRTLEESGIVEGVVESARPLGDSELESLQTSLGARLGGEVRLSQRANEELVGGVRVFVGTSMIDRSVQGRLDSMRRRLEGARA